MVRGLALGVVLALAAVGSASAEGPATRVRLRWNAPDQCPDDAQVVAAIEGFLGQRLAESREQDLKISVSVQGVEGSYSAKLIFVGPHGTQERYLEHPECPKLAEAAALLAALAIDPERVKARQEAEQAAGASVDTPASAPEPAPIPAPTPVVSPVAPAPCPPDRPPSQPGRGFRVNTSVLGFIGVGTLPGVVPGVAAEIGVRRGSFRAVLFGRHWTGSNVEVTAATPSSIDLSLATGGLRGCLLPVAAEWVLLGCLGADVGDMAGAGQDVDDARSRHDLFAAVEASFSVAYARSEPKPLLGLALSLPLRRPAFGVLRGGEPLEAFRPSQVGLNLFLGLASGL